MPTTDDPMCQDARHCPRRGALGILPLDQAGEHGQIADPMMLCPSCETEFTATGMTWSGAIDVAGLTDEQLDELAQELVDAFFHLAVPVKWPEPVTPLDRSRPEADSL